METSTKKMKFSYPAPGGDSCVAEAKKLKHEADKEKDVDTKIRKYLEAIMMICASGTRTEASGEQASAFSMYIVQPDHPPDQVRHEAANEARQELQGYQPEAGGDGTERPEVIFW